MITCQICKEKSYNNNRTLSKHLKNVHNIKFELYAKENNIWPKCKNTNCENFTKTLFNDYCSTKCRSNDKIYIDKVNITKKVRFASGEIINWTDKRIRTKEIDEKMLKRNEKLSITIQQLANEGNWGHDQSEDEKRKRSETMLKTMKEHPEIRLNQWNNDEYRKKHRESLKKAYESQELRDKISIAVHKSMTPEVKKQISESVCDTITNTNWAENVKNGYKKGIYNALKSKNKKGTNEIIYRSSYERKAFIKLDYDKNVKEWLYEHVKVPLDEIHNTVPDLKVFYNDGITKIIEVKPKNQINNEYNVKKFKALKEYCDKNDMKFEIWTEDNL